MPLSRVQEDACSTCLTGNTWLTITNMPVYSACLQSLNAFRKAERWMMIVMM